MAKRKHTTIILPESDNVILIPDTSREPIIIPVECLIHIPENKSIFEIGRELDAWLSHGEFKRLIFDDDPGFYYNAICNTEIRVNELRNKKTNVITLEFLCDPELKAV